MLAELDFNRIEHWTGEDKNFWSEEFSELQLGDARLDQRFLRLIQSFSDHPGSSIYEAAGSWGQAKAAYRFLDHESVDAHTILSQHRVKTWERMKSHSTVLAIQDTSLLNYNSHPFTRGLGSIGKHGSRKKPSQGLVVHSTLAVGVDGTPLGLLDQQIWTRKSRSKKISSKQPSNKESAKWFNALQSSLPPKEEGSLCRVITVADREADISDWIQLQLEQRSDFIVRGKKQRSLQTAHQSLLGHMLRLEPQGEYELQIKQDEKGLGERWRKKRVSVQRRTAHLEIRFATVTLQASCKLSKAARRCGLEKVSPLRLQCVYVREKDPPRDAPEVEWLLLTNLPVNCIEQAQEVILYYQRRWTIEVFHKALKSGCQVEACQLEEAPRLIRYLTMKSLVAWRICQMTYFHRNNPDVSCEIVLEPIEWKALYCRIHKSPQPPSSPPSVREAMIWIAQLGGFLARKGDGSPGILVMNRGWQKLIDLVPMYQLFQSAATYG